MVASAEEESSGENGLNSVCCPLFHIVDCGNYWRTHFNGFSQLQKKGWLFLMGLLEGTPSHAAHPNNNNSIYNTIEVLTMV